MERNNRNNNVAIKKCILDGETIPIEFDACAKSSDSEDPNAVYNMEYFIYLGKGTYHSCNGDVCKSNEPYYFYLRK